MASNYTNMDERSERIAKRFEWPIFIAALLVIPVIAIERSSAGEPWTSLAAAANWAIWLAFATELVVMLAVVPDRRRWLRKHPTEVVIVILSPPLLPQTLQVLRALRVVLILVRGVRLTTRIFSFEGLGYSALLALITALGGGAAYAAVEKGNTTWEGVWWAIVTMTTVGYGDVSPQTDDGRVIGVIVMLVGIGFVAMATGALAQRFVSSVINGGAGGVEEGPDVVAPDVVDPDVVEPDVVAELQEITARLHRLEARLGRRHSSPG